MMDFWIWLFLGVIAVWILWFRFHGRVGLAKAKAFLRAGALVIDVRTEQEFAVKNLPGVINLPLHEVAAKIHSLEPDKDRVILCFCVSGGRSAIGMGRLRKLGYSKAYNLGSLDQATALMKGSNLRHPGR